MTKNKVLNLFESSSNKITTGSETPDALFSDFFRKTSHFFPDDLEQDQKINIATQIWNLGCINLPFPTDDAEKQGTLPGDEEFLLVFRKLIDIKRKDFADFDFCVTDFDDTDFQSTGVIQIETMPLPEYLEMMESERDDETELFDDDEELTREGTINRVLIILEHQKPFFEWINRVDPENPINSAETSVYLIPEELEADIEKHLRKKFDKYFILELENWHLNKKEWPQNRNFKLFSDWFRITTTTVAYDTVARPIEKN